MTLTWEQLEAGLAVELPYLEHRDNVILEIAPAGGFVQLWQETERLVLEAWGLHLRSPEPRLPVEMEVRLAVSGWEPPAGDPEANWSRAYPWPVAASTGAEAAAVLIGALRDVFGAAGPETLTYRAWNDQDGTRLEWPVFRRLRASVVPPG
ncbi:TY-Chap domain-containing protein [Catenuloplanes japonicus]|uniref:TY-Chap domain-containing protein n=1 Tax=Catenuloplanes japonicus TaxID=33876 RepID=UPI000525C5F7|nr:hypothetical protein [Catenuloplanes japonicus]